MKKNFLIGCIVVSVTSFLLFTGCTDDKPSNPSVDILDENENDNENNDQNENSGNAENGNQEGVQGNQGETGNGDAGDSNGNGIDSGDLEEEPFTHPFITENDIVLLTGFEPVNESYQKVLKDFVRLSLLGYTGESYKNDLQKLNDRIFKEDSLNKEDYKLRMDNFSKHVKDKNFTNGWSEVEVVGDVEKTNTSLTMEIYIVHHMVYKKFQTGVGYQENEVATGVNYTIKFVEEEDGIFIESCLPDAKNPFDGAEGTGEILLVRPEIEFNETEFQYPEEIAQLSAGEQEVIKQFVLQSVLADQGYAALDTVVTINEEIFHPDAQQKYDYMKHMSTIERYAYVYRTCEVNVEFMEMSGTEEERVIKLSILKTRTSGSWSEGVLKGNEKNSSQWIYVLTLQKVDDKVFITNCIKHENAPY